MPKRVKYYRNRYRISKIYKTKNGETKVVLYDVIKRKSKTVKLSKQLENYIRKYRPTLVKYLDAKEDSMNETSNKTTEKRDIEYSVIIRSNEVTLVLHIDNDVIIINKDRSLFEGHESELLEGIYPIENVLTVHDVLKTITIPDLFYSKLDLNPYDDVKKKLERFIVKGYLVVLPNGNFLGYKYICEKDDQYVSCYDMKTVHEIDKPVIVVEYDTNPKEACSKGLHVASYRYLDEGYIPGDKIMIVEVDPRDVVAIPDNEKYEKLRCKKYVPRLVFEKNEFNKDLILKALKLLKGSRI